MVGAVSTLTAGVTLQAYKAPSPDVSARPDQLARADRAGAAATSADQAIQTGSAATLTPEQAFASDAELGPPPDELASQVHTEIKVDGRVVARVYNSGIVEIAEEYAFLAGALLTSLASGATIGPELAQARAGRIKATLNAHGGRSNEEQPSGAGANGAALAPIVELLMASTAQSQDEWLAARKADPTSPGSFVSRDA